MNCFTKTELCTRQSKLDIFIIKNENKDSELKTAAYIAIHSSIKSSTLLYHLAELNGIQLHRTKSTMLIKNLISESFNHQLVEDVGSQQFSLFMISR